MNMIHNRSDSERSLLMGSSRDPAFTDSDNTSIYSQIQTGYRNFLPLSASIPPFAFPRNRQQLSTQPPAPSYYIEAIPGGDTPRSLSCVPYHSFRVPVGW